MDMIRKMAEHNIWLRFANNLAVAEQLNDDGTRSGYPVSVQLDMKQTDEQLEAAIDDLVDRSIVANYSKR